MIRVIGIKTGKTNLVLKHDHKLVDVVFGYETGRSVLACLTEKDLSIWQIVDPPKPTDNMMYLYSLLYFPCLHFLIC